MDLVYPAGRAGIRKNWSLSPSSYDHRTSLSPSSVPDWSLLLEELLHIISKNMDDCFDVVHAHSVGTLCRSICFHDYAFICLRFTLLKEALSP
ncbi:unnamed protein product [Brassica rapa subsp. trilocularis]